MYTGTVSTVSNREQWEFDIMEVVDDDTGDLIDLTNATIVFQVVDKSGQPVLAGSTDDGLIIRPTTSSFQIVVPRERITGLCQSVYDIGVTIENAGVVKSFIIGTVTVLRGLVPA